MDIADEVSLVLSLLSIAVSVFAIWQGVHYYRLSTDVSHRMMQVLNEVAATARVTQATTDLVTRRTIDALVGRFERRVDDAEQESRIRVVESLALALAEAPARERAQAQSAAARAVRDVFIRLRSEAGPRTEAHDWSPFLHRLALLERSHAFLSVKWLQRRVFAGEPAFQEALRVAIEREIVRTYSLPNPRRPGFPTLCCAVNREHPVVRRFLKPQHLRESSG